MAQNHPAPGFAMPTNYKWFLTFFQMVKKKNQKQNIFLDTWGKKQNHMKLRSLSTDKDIPEHSLIHSRLHLRLPSSDAECTAHEA